MKKERLDKVLTDLGYFETKSKASAAILAGAVKINDEVITKAGYQIDSSKEYNFLVKSMPYVSRGGFKLQKALDTFNFSPENRICLDAGASTGGFTDCLLQRGAKFVYAVDVGYGQIDWKLRMEKRVKVVEKTNLKLCSLEDVYSPGEEMPDLCVSDLSFISLTKVLPNIKTLLSDKKQEYICLIKPQFEAGKEQVEKGGVVKDSAIHAEVIKNVCKCVKELNFNIYGLTHSSIKGPAGNIEYLIWFGTDRENNSYNIEMTVKTAHEVLD